jgi:hypothetical protein
MIESGMRSSVGFGQSSFGEDRTFNGVKVFSATMVADREKLGEKITEWLTANPQIDVRDMVVTQSSDEAFHCLAITVFFWEGQAQGRR